MLKVLKYLKERENYMYNVLFYFIYYRENARYT